MEYVFEELDKPFTENEIETCIKGLNRNKSPGVDNILNEYILEGKTILIPILCKPKLRISQNTVIFAPFHKSGINR
jgi:hypothetical protein